MNSTRFTLTLPHADNEGTPVPFAHEWLTHTLLSTFGGFTSHEVSGQWREGPHGRTYTDESTVYTVDTDASTVLLEGIAYSPAQAVARIARSVRYLALQECVYVTRQSLDREFVA